MINNQCDHYWAESDYLPFNAVLSWWCEKDPVCMEAKKHAIIAALTKDEIKYGRSDGFDYPDPVENLIGRKILMIHRESFEKWAKKIDANANLHLPSTLPYLDPKHPFPAKELKIAVEAWMELYERNPPDGVPQGGHKKYIFDWLKSKYPSNKDLGTNARERIATIINPNPQGGASPSIF